MTIARAATREGATGQPWPPERTPEEEEADLRRQERDAADQEQLERARGKALLARWTAMLDGVELNAAGARVALELAAEIYEQLASTLEDLEWWKRFACANTPRAARAILVAQRRGAAAKKENQRRAARASPTNAELLKAIRRLQRCEAGGERVIAKRLGISRGRVRRLAKKG
ncbi:hypothetical protein [Anaeromyxobacter dehalogenans]|uniref:Uncharacterized protein n=1 Tax=Anaeromyxobacter dehalogenans (strain 2CP-C) TaxID=290397 RepID=Q2IIT4_ANADE|nr:hypothetical protein [Anaeromyxobacter dehalogenans]ABC81564.1 hypothetical protein Adeh_1791 [Anaeromyxobacter dehalogenans 2CP-C]